MSKITLLLLLTTLSILNASAQNADAPENNMSAEQLREYEIEDLIKSLQARINANKVFSKGSNDAITKKAEEKDQSPDQSDTEGRITSTEGSIYDMKSDDSSSTSESEAQARIEKRKVYDLLANDEPSVLRNQLSEQEKNGQDYLRLLRLQNLYRLYNQRLEADQPANEERPSRHCGSDLLTKKMSRVTTSRVRYLERSRVIADKIAEAALHLLRKKERFLDCLGCGCGRNRLAQPAVIIDNQPIIVEEAPPIVVVDEATKRDVEVASASSSATSLDAAIDVPGLSAASSLDTSSASATSISSGVGGVATSVDAASSISSGVSLGSSLGGSGLHTGIASESHLNVGAGVGGGLSFLRQLNSCEDFERKMIMDMAIEDAAAMIRDLAAQTRDDFAHRDDPLFERRILGLAIDLVNKVTSGVTGDVTGGLSALKGFRYHGVDDYLKASIDEGEAQLLSNAGFDYNMGKTLAGRRLYDDLDLYDDYVGHDGPFSRGTCDTCSRLDLGLGDRCPLCKRSGRSFKGRNKRYPIGGAPKGKIYHLEQLAEVQNKVKTK